jgi:hypothetical protein
MALRDLFFYEIFYFFVYVKTHSYGYGDVRIKSSIEVVGYTIRDHEVSLGLKCII